MVLPEPLAPRIATNSCRRNATDTPSKAFVVVSPHDNIFLYPLTLTLRHPFSLSLLCQDSMALLTQNEQKFILGSQ